MKMGSKGAVTNEREIFYDFITEKQFQSARNADNSNNIFARVSIC